MDSLEVFKRACRDTKSYLGAKWQTSIPVVYFVVGSIIHFIRFGAENVMDEVQVFLSYVVYPVFIFGGVLFIWNVFLAPFKNLHETKSGDKVGENEIIKPINFKPWRHVEKFMLFQAACLWAEKEPALPVRSGDEYAYFIMLRNACDSQKIRITPESISRRANKFYRWRYNSLTDIEIMRDELIKFAESKQQRPKFLFPEER